MKRTLGAAAFFMTITIAPAQSGEDKVTICHETLR